MKRASEFAYSDGAEFEDELVETLERRRDLSSGARIAPDFQARSWPARYHLSPERANLVRQFRFTGLHLLELGAGCGGLSRFLGEQAASLTAVEGSPIRTAALRRRLRGLTHARAIEGRIESVKLDRPFDVVLLVGVLEYAGLYGVTPDGFAGDPFDALLERAASFLAPDGVLLIAIENRIGIKYWSGAPDDHSGRLFDGPAGFPSAPGARTFSRHELASRLAARGFRSTRWQYPFPDYKLPMSVLTSELLEEEPAIAVDLATTRPFETPPYRRPFLFPDALALDGVARAGLLAEFCNSFLVLASRSPASPTLARLLPEPELRAWHYAPARRDPVVTLFSRRAALLEVEKRRLPIAAPREVAVAPEDASFFWRGQDRTPVARGESVRLRLMRRLYFGETVEFVGELLDFLRFVIERRQVAPGRLDRHAVDARYNNAVRTDGGAFELFDLEWEAREPIPTTWVVLRNVLALLPEAPALGASSGLASLGELYTTLLSALALEPALESDLVIEESFLRAALWPERTPSCEGLRSALETPLATGFASATGLLPRPAGRRR